ncbi:MAG TPA: hypothetical protein VNH11_29545 [Pirellulales bacterium]|nr:hypothetical protein [Pirellulales bacterium]
MDSIANKPLPHCKAFLICKEVTEDEETGEISLYALIETFRQHTFPGPTAPFVVFLQVYDGIGRYQMSIEANALDDDASVARATVADLDFPERLAKIDIAIPVDSVYLPRPGRYELLVFVDGQELARQYFNAEIQDVEQQ